MRVVKSFHVIWRSAGNPLINVVYVFSCFSRDVKLMTKIWMLYSGILFYRFYVAFMTYLLVFGGLVVIYTGTFVRFFFQEMTSFKLGPSTRSMTKRGFTRIFF